MSTASELSEPSAATAAVRPAPRLVQIKADADLDPYLGVLGIACIYVIWTPVLFVAVAPLNHSLWIILAGLAALFCALIGQREAVRNRLREPVVRLSATRLRPGDELLVECELRAKKAATVRSATITIESYERYGEDIHHESYGEQNLPCSQTPVGETPMAVRQILLAPTPRPRQRAGSRWWSRSSLDWHITLRVVAEGGMTLQRSYPINIEA